MHPHMTKPWHFLLTSARSPPRAASGTGSPAGLPSFAAVMPEKVNSSLGSGLPPLVCDVSVPTLLTARIEGSQPGQEDSVGSWCDGLGDLREMQVHRLGVASQQDQGRTVAPLGADRAEDIGGSGALVTWRARTRAALLLR